MVVFGGYSFSQRAFPSDTWLWSFETFTWTNASNAVRPAAFSTSYTAFLNQSSMFESVLAFGGVTGNSLADFASYFELNSTWIFDGQSRTWRFLNLPVVPPARSAAASALYHNTDFYVFGGFSSFAASLNDVWVFHLSSMTWERVNVSGPIPEPRGAATFELLGDNLYVIGGCSSLFTVVSGYGTTCARYVVDAWIFNIPSRTWSTAPIVENLNPAYLLPSTIIDATSILIYATVEDTTSSMVMYNTSTNASTVITLDPVSPAPGGREGGSMVLYQGISYLFGGLIPR